MKKISLSDRNALVKGFQKYVLFLKTYNSIIKQSIYHGYAHLLSVIAMGAGAISFVHIVKALTPLFAAFFSFFLMNNRMSIYTYSSLLPIVFGVSLASLKELSFTYKALYSTLSANVLSTMRIFNYTYNYFFFTYFENIFMLR
ncbi:phosphoenolpyruvate/phosphate translocator, putative [Plasmodium malariae]|uniref:Phosphoenolpyruvate/phosphate translocator, putative n=1 Tax=Plasmodium malariae TaxID=5858 RepID=A0A1C3KDC1_PLAMA|nr:phosphoenolpyruvate/phosphate translocator, putative [Plasmodium malariae]